MLTVPAYFSKRSGKQDDRRHWLIVIAGGDPPGATPRSYIGISDAHFRFASGTVTEFYPILKSISGLSQQMDWKTRMSPQVSLTIEIDNNPCDHLAGQRPSDLGSTIWDNIIDGYVEVYACVGYEAASLSDCLLVYKGVVQKWPEHDLGRMTLDCIDYSNAYGTVLPSKNLTKTVFEDNAKRIPLFYGKVPRPYSADDVYNKRGQRLRALRSDGNKWYLADGDLYTSGTNLQVWIKSKILDGAFLRVVTLPTRTTDSNGTYLEFTDRQDIDVDVYVPPSGLANSSDNLQDSPTIIEHQFAGQTSDVFFQVGETTQEVTDEDLAYDGDAATKADVKSATSQQWPYSGSSWSMFKASCGFEFPDVLPSGVSMANSIDNANVYICFRANLITPSGYTIYWGTGLTDLGTGLFVRTSTQNSYPAAAYANTVFDDTDKEIEQDGDWNAAVGLKFSNAAVQAWFLVMGSDSDPSSPPAIPTGSVLEIKEVYLRVRLGYRFREGDEVYVSGEGCQIGTDIATLSGLSASAVNEFPCYQVLAILAENLGLTTSDMDTQSFVDVYRSDIKSHISIQGDEARHWREVIQEICENANFAFQWDGTNKVHLLPINPTPPGTPDALIMRADLVDHPVATKTEPDLLINSFGITHDWDYEREEFHETTEFTDATLYNTYPATLEMKLVDKDTAVDADFQAALKNLHSAPARAVEFTTIAWKYLHLEIGDWVQFEYAPLDAQGKHFGTSWNGLSFMIDGKEIMEDTNTIKFRAIAL